MRARVTFIYEAEGYVDPSAIGDAVQLLTDTLASDKMHGLHVKDVSYEILEQHSDLDIERIASRVLSLCRPALRAAVGDRTPAQYDRADAMAEAIVTSVHKALIEHRGEQAVES